jgi:cellulose biosynthesis protein BcsQ
VQPKVGRSTTVWQLGAELALRGKRVRIEDLDQGAHLSRTLDQYPLGLERLQLAGARVKSDGVDVVLLDTAPEAQHERAIEILRRADWAIVPVKGPEASSVQALPMLMQWVSEARRARAVPVTEAILFAYPVVSDAAGDTVSFDYWLATNFFYPPLVPPPSPN